MTSELMVRYFEGRPFIPFEMYLADRRILKVPHPEYAAMERFAAGVTIFEDSGHIETVDAALIVSFRTLKPLD
ncbi:MAG: hypothetical protein JWL69_2867 [Phycisphaerales bacterium]|nr:hypothetical protein [Phycisphaerales bacterium]MDB5357828.1 hypothetical protein [Phycisphaerales bacterium]